MRLNLSEIRKHQEDTADNSVRLWNEIREDVELLRQGLDCKLLELQLEGKKSKQERVDEPWKEDFERVDAVIEAIRTDGALVWNKLKVLETRIDELHGFSRRIKRDVKNVADALLENML